MPDTLGDRIRHCRTDQHVSQRQLAHRVGLTAPNLCQIELGQHEPKAFTLRCIADALGVSADYLLGRTETP